MRAVCGRSALSVTMQRHEYEETFVLLVLVLVHVAVRVRVFVHDAGTDRVHG